MVLASMPWVMWRDAASAHLAKPAGVFGPWDFDPLVWQEASLRGEVGGLGFWFSGLVEVTGDSRSWDIVVVLLVRL